MPRIDERRPERCAALALATAFFISGPAARVRVRAWEKANVR